MWLTHILISCLIVFLSDFVSSNTCTVKVTGRNRSYDEVRETIVNEDWRDDVEDEIKRHKQRVRRAYYQRNRDFTVNALGPLENVYLNIYANLKYIKSGFGIATGTVPQGFPGVGREGTTRLNYNNAYVKEGLALQPEDTLIVQVFDDFNIADRKYRDTAVIFQEHPICVTEEQVKEFQAQNKGKFNETAFVDQNEENIENGLYPR